MTARKTTESKPDPEAVEVQADLARLGPAEPVGEMRRLDLVAVDDIGAGLGVECVEVEPLPAGQELEHDIDVGAHLVAVAGAAGMAAGGHDAAGIDPVAGSFKAADVVSLPAVQGDRNREGLFDGGFGVDANVGVVGAGESVGGGDLFGRGHGGETAR